MDYFSQESSFWLKSGLKKVRLEFASLTLGDPMKKTVRKKKKAAPKFKGPTMLDKLPKNRGEWLALVIKFTERAIDPGFPDKGMVAQAERLKAELAEWNKANPNL
jgi:hypothetical protein